MNGLKLLVLVLLFSFTQVAAFADQNVSLVTISSGSEIFQSFGHTMVMVEDSEKTNEVVLYEYGGNDLSELLLRALPKDSGSSQSKKDMDVGEFEQMTKVLDILTKLFESKIPAKAARLKSKFSDASKLPSVLEERYLNPGASFRKITINKLKLSQTQAVEFERLLKVDAKAGEYNYDNFKNNCATRIRDLLFSDGVLGKRPAALDESLDVSLQEISMSELDEAAASRCIGQNQDSCSPMFFLLPPALLSSSRGKAAADIIRQFGLKNSFASAKEFYSQIKIADRNLRLISSMLPNPKLAESFHDNFFSETLTKKPNSKWDTLFTPKNLRSALVDLGVAGSAEGDETSFDNLKTIHEEAAKKKSKSSSSKN